MLTNRKKRMRTIKVILCSIVLVLTNVLIFMEPMGSGAQEVVQPDAGLRKISLGDFDIEDGTYNKANPCSGTYINGMQNTYFLAKVKFSTGAQLFLGGTDEEKGLRFMLSSNDLSMKDADGAISGTYKFKPNDAGLSESTFKNTEFTLGVTLQIANLDTDGVEDDVKIGVWFNGTLYQGQYIEFIDYKDHVGNVLSTKFSNNSAQLDLSADVNVGASPKKTWKQLTFSHFYLEDGNYGYNEGNVAAKGSYTVSLDQTYFTGNVTFSENSGVSLRYGGRKTDEGLSGLMFGVVDGKLRMADALGNSNLSYDYDAQTAGLEFASFAGEQFKLGLSIEYVDGDDDGQVDDVSLGVWFNDVLYGNEYVVLPDYVNLFGSTVGIISYEEQATLTIASIPELVAVMPDPSLKKLTFDHFSIEDKVYSYNSNRVSANGKYGGAFDGTYFGGTVAFGVNANGNSSDIRYATTDADGWVGLRLYVLGGKLLVRHSGEGTVYAALDASTAGIKSFTEEFRLGISMQYVDMDNDDDELVDDVKLGLFFNDELYDDTYLYLENYVEKVGSGLSVYCEADTTLKVGTLEDFIDYGTPIQLDSTYRKLTFEHFALEDKTYSYNNNKHSALGFYKESLDKTWFSGTVTFSNESARLIYGTDQEGWNGLYFKVAGGNLRLAINDSGAKAIFTPNKAGVSSFTDSPFHLGISAKIVDMDDDGLDDVELGVWFNDVLYKNEFVYLEDYAEKLGQYISIYCPADTTLTTQSRDEFIDYGTPIKLDSSYKKITFEQFVLDDGTYTYNSNRLSAKGFYKNSLDTTWFSGTLTYSNDEGVGGSAQFIYGGHDAEGWNGLYFKIVGNNLVMALDNGRPAYNFTPKTAGVESFMGTPFHLGISTKIVDIDEDGKDDVAVGVWINDVLYANEFICLQDYVDRLGHYSSIYCPEGTSLTIASRESFIPGMIIIEPDPGMTQLSFDSFGYSDATVAFNNNFLSGNGIYRKTMDNTHFTGTVLFTGEGPDIRYGGAGDGWTGLQITVRGDKLMVRDAAGKSEAYFFVAKRAGLDSFINKKFNLGISTKFVDSDKDGVTDDVELGIWFNDVLYNGEYIYLLDYAPNLKGGLGLYVPQGDAKLTIKSIPIPLDFTIFGFTSNWANELKIYANSK